MSRARDNANLSPTIADARMPNLTGAITTVEGAVATTIANDAVDSQHYAAGSIDNEHLADDAVGTDELANDVVINTSGAITTTGALDVVGAVSEDVTQTHDGIGIYGTAGMNTGDAKYTPGIKFGSADASFTTTNPKFLAFIAGRSTQVYNGDGDAGMALDFLTTPDNAGTAPDPTLRMSIASAGDVTVSTGDLIFGTAGKGVVLGATTNVDANTLDDYEEGTWTGALAAGGAAMTSATNAGTYTKIGDTVFITIKCYLTSLNSATGNISLTGLPFTEAGGIAGFSLAYFPVNTIDDAMIVARMSGGTAIDFMKGDALSVTVQHSDLTLNLWVMLSGTYQV